MKLADTPARQQAALTSCEHSSRLSDVQAGLGLAGLIGNPQAERRLHERAGDLLLESKDYAHAPGIVSAGQPFRPCQ